MNFAAIFYVIAPCSVVIMNELDYPDVSAGYTKITQQFWRNGWMLQKDAMIDVGW